LFSPNQEYNSRVTAKQTALLCMVYVALILSGCGIQGEQAAPTQVSLEATATLPVPTALSSSETPLPPPPQPTATPVAGTASTQINVRAEPSTSGSVLGMIPANTIVQILGRDLGGNWWQILYEGGVEGKGWVSAQYVTTADPDAIPVIGGDPADPGNVNVAIVQQQINVRSGPGTSFDSLGTLNAQDVVSLTGKDSNGAWLQIAFSAGPEGKGWVNAAFVRAQGVENLPIITEAGQVVGTGTPTSIPATPTPTILPAWNDQDSQSNPAASVSFELAGTHTLIYSGDVSAPEGDSEDWVQFKPYGRTIFVSLACAGSPSLDVELFEDGVRMKDEVACGDQTKAIAAKAGSNYLLHLYVSSSAGTLHYIDYTIKIEMSPT
jgi:uncharacterized protein YraI